jgi:hypothetical protein
MRCKKEQGTPTVPGINLEYPTHTPDVKRSYALINNKIMNKINMLVG